MNYIIAYNPEWPFRFVQISEWLRKFIPLSCKIHHVGSTSVPGMPSKDIIDMDIECPSGSMPVIIQALALAGYSHQGDKGITGREAFHPMAGSEAEKLPVHFLYACESGAYELKKHLAYREYLKAHQERALWLASEKIAADAAASSRAEYIENKAAAYGVITAESLAYFDRQ